MIEFGELTPDLPPEVSGCTVAHNVLPSASGYHPLPSLGVFSTNAINSKALGAFSSKEDDGTILNFVGSATKIYKLSVAAFADVSISGDYTVAADDHWEFVQFGNTVIATNFTDVMQTWTLGTSSAFAVLGGSPPKAKHLAVVGGFVVSANLDESGTLLPHKVRWSALDNAASWTASIATQSGSQELIGSAGQSPVQHIVGGEYATIMTERSIWRMTYQGTPLIWSFSEIETGRGLAAPRGAATVGRNTFYISEDGFMVTDGTSSTPIGTNKIDRFFFNDASPAHISKMTAGVDPVGKYVFWAYTSAAIANDSYNDKAIIFDYVNNRWSTAEFDTELLFTATSTAVTLDNLDSIYGSIDAVPFSLDDAIWSGNRLLLGAMDKDHKLAYFNGLAADAVLETGEFQPLPGRRSLLTNVKPFVTGITATTTIQTGYRDAQSNAVAFNDAITLNGTGDAGVRSDSWFHRIRANITGGFNTARGIEVKWKARGRR